MVSSIPEAIDYRSEAMLQKLIIPWKSNTRFECVHSSWHVICAQISLILHYCIIDSAWYNFVPRSAVWIAWLHRCEATRQYTRAHNKCKQLRFDGKVPTTCTRVDADTKQSNVSALPNMSTAASLHCCVCALFKQFTKLLQRCVRKSITFNMPMALNVFHLNCWYNTSCWLSSWRVEIRNPLFLSPPPLIAHASVYAAIQSTTQKCRWRMPQTIAKRQMFHGFAWTYRDLGRSTCHRHEPFIRSC